MNIKNTNKKLKKSYYESDEVLFFDQDKKKKTVNVNEIDLEDVDPSLKKLASNINYLKSIDLDDETYNLQKKQILDLFSLEMENKIKLEETEQVKIKTLINNRNTIQKHLKDVFEPNDRKEDFTGLCQSFWNIHILLRTNIPFIKEDNESLDELISLQMGNQLRNLREKRDFNNTEQRELNKLKDLFSNLLNSYLIRTNDWSILSLENIEPENIQDEEDDYWVDDHDEFAL